MPDTRDTPVFPYSSDRYALVDLGGRVGWLLSTYAPGFMPSIASTASAVATIWGFLYSTRFTSFHVWVALAERCRCSTVPDLTIIVCDGAGLPCYAPMPHDQDGVLKEARVPGAGNTQALVTHPTDKPRSISAASSDGCYPRPDQA